MSGIQARIAHELSLIHQLHYAPYFLTVDEVVRFARSKGILCQERGSRQLRNIVLASFGVSMRQSKIPKGIIAAWQTIDFDDSQDGLFIFVPHPLDPDASVCGLPIPSS